MTTIGQLGIKRIYVVYTLVTIVLLCLLSLLGMFDRLDLFFLDRAFNLRGPQEPNSAVAVVAISQEDFERGAPRWPWPRSVMARLIDQLAEERPAVIAIDIQYGRKTSTETLLTRENFDEIRPYVYQALAGVKLEIQSPDGLRVIGPGNDAFDKIVLGSASAEAQDQELADAVGRAVDMGVPVILSAQTVSGMGVRGLSQPYDALLESAGGSIGLVGVRTDDDGVLRRYIPYGLDADGNLVYGLAIEAVARYLDATLPSTILPGGDVPIGSDTVIAINDGSFQVNFPGPPGTHLTVNAGDLLDGRIGNSETLTGKIVFVGVSDPSAEDLVATPFSGSERMAGVEFHASAASTILNDAQISTTPRYQVLFIIFVMVLVAVVLGRFMRPAIGILGAVVAAAGLLVVWSVSFSLWDYALPVAGPLVALVIGYSIAIADRVRIEQLNILQARSMLSRYLPNGVVKELLNDPVAAQLGAKRAEVTILFADIRGFTAISEKLEPEVVVGMLNEYLTVMTEIIFKHEGTIDKFEGDAILAFFGAPQAHDDDPERAVRTALEMRSQLDGLQDRWQELTKTSLKIGIGINCGAVMVGNIGSERRMDYTVIGDAVNLAARLQELTKEHDAPILISGEVASRLNGAASTRFIGKTEIRGRENAVDLYEVSELEMVTLTASELVSDL
ncbi:MAG: adenylate/guanylate cyclase domain-containing protein [SAR202 cluster bacterium]|nr:adenylate/guanylate cyclase domain-containing protein [SAR202 cluster bacterium]